MTGEAKWSTGRGATASSHVIYCGWRIPRPCQASALPVDAQDLIHALRMWLPDGKSVAGARQELEPTLAAAFAEFDQGTPRSGVSGPEELLPVASTAVARALLQQAVEAAKDAPGGQLHVLQPVPARPDGGLPQLGDDGADRVEHLVHGGVSNAVEPGLDAGGGSGN